MYASKDRLRVVVVTATYKVEGDIHLLAGSRLTDALNSKAKDFFALTGASVYRLSDDKLMYEPSYLAVNREAIDCIFPVEP